MNTNVTKNHLEASEFVMRGIRKKNTPPPPQNMKDLRLKSRVEEQLNASPDDVL